VAGKIIIDSGVLTAFLDKRDFWHSWALENFKTLPKPFVTCEAVIAETSYLLQNVFSGQETLLSLLESGLIELDFSLSDEISDVKTLMKKYADVPMDLADACLVRMCELTDNSTVFTLDSDFRIYRKNGKGEITLIIP
jgi:uncharacterized protein